MFSNKYSFSHRNSKKVLIEEVGIRASQASYEIMELISIYKDLRPSRVLEIGSEFGGSLWFWIMNTVGDATIINIDMLQNMPEEIELEKQWQQWSDRVKGVKLHSIIGSSHDDEVYHQVLDMLDGEKLDFLFIDGDHTLAGARQDFMMYGSLVREGGIIALHDIQNPDNPKQQHIQVSVLMREIQVAGYKTRELHAMYPNPWGGGIGVVYV
jgi:cephalosporin hydroxylase